MHQQTSTQNTLMPFYLEQNLSTSKKFSKRKFIKDEGLDCNWLILTPQKNDHKNIEFDKLISVIEPVNNFESKSFVSEKWDTILNEQNQKVSENYKQCYTKQTEIRSSAFKNVRKVSKQITSSQIINLNSFIYSPIEKNRVIKCTIRREKSGLKTFFPQYTLMTSKQQKPLLFAKKQAGNRTSNYRIFTSKEDTNFVAKLRSNFFGTDYNLYDNGDNPKKNKKTNRPRKRLAQMHYQNKFMMCNSGPKRMQVYTPDPQIPIIGTSQTLQQLYKYNPNNVIAMTNKLPKWNSKMGAYLLDLQDRANVPSIKNFILVHQDNSQMTMLLLGKVDDDNFNLDVYYPLSIVQAFGIVLSTFDFKLACE